MRPLLGAGRRRRRSRSGCLHEAPKPRPCRGWTHPSAPRSSEGRAPPLLPASPTAGHLLDSPPDGVDAGSGAGSLGSTHSHLCSLGMTQFPLLTPAWGTQLPPFPLPFGVLWPQPHGHSQPSGRKEDSSPGAGAGSGRGGGHGAACGPARDTHLGLYLARGRARPQWDQSLCLRSALGGAWPSAECCLEEASSLLPPLTVPWPWVTQSRDVPTAAHH